MVPKEKIEPISIVVPHELIVEILLRLPVESLLRCKSVCKLWCSLISDYYFVKSHLKLSTTNNQYSHHQLICITVRSLKSCPLNDEMLGKSVMNFVDHAYPLSVCSNRLTNITEIVGSCNGLLCIDIKRTSTFICNPSTRMWNRLPSPGFVRPIMVYGFGYDYLTDDYKVVGIFEAWKSETWVFSLKSGKWKNIDGGTQMQCLHNAVFSNGSIHWPARDSMFSSDYVIVSFDLAKEIYGQVAKPVYDDGVDAIFRLGVLGDSLCVVYYYRGNRVDVWVMKVYGVKDSWTKFVSIPCLTALPILYDHISVPLFISNDGKVLLQLGTRLVVYDSKYKSFSVIHNFGGCYQVCNFVESLVSPSTTAGLAVNNVDDE